VYDTLLAKYSDDVKAEVERFTKFAALVDIEVEPFQKLILSEVFNGARELLCLLPRGNGKTTLFAVFALYHLVTVPDAAIYCAAATREQATLLFNEARRLARAHPSIEKRVTFRHNYIATKRGFMRVLASDHGGRLHGLIPSLVLVDELHAHKTPDTYVALKTAMGKRPDAQMVVITTAGWDPEGTLARLRGNALKFDSLARHGYLTTARDEDAHFSFLEWAVPVHEDIGDAAIVKKANPATFVTEAFLREQIASPGLHASEFARYHGNQWTSAHDGWLPEGAWEALADEAAMIPPRAQVWIGVDIGYMQDCSAVVVCWPRPDGQTIVKAKVWKPDGEQLELDQIEAHISELAGTYRVMGVVYDPALFVSNAQRLSNAGLVMVKHPQSDGRMLAASTKLYDGIMGGHIAHDGDPVLAAHVNAGAIKPMNAGFRLVKGSTKLPIDALIALALGYSQVGNEAQAREVTAEDVLMIL
jgi:phage terminase large subunit-like protein